MFKLSGAKNAVVTSGNTTTTISDNIESSGTLLEITTVINGLLDDNYDTLVLIVRKENDA